MKKTLVALAALTLVGAVAAQSTVTLFGKVTTGLRVATQKTNGVATATGNVGAQQVASIIGGSRWGLRGSEDLGGGLKANFHLEQGFGADTGAANAGTHQFSRQSWVGLSGGFGSITGGEQYNVYDTVLCSIGVQGCASQSASAYALGSTVVFGVHTDLSSFQTPGNVFQYVSPDMGGFKLMGQYAPGENKNPVTGQAAGNMTGLMGSYAAGPLSAYLGWESVKTTAAAGVSTTVRNTSFGGTYDLGVAKISALYERASTSASSARDTGWLLGTIIPLGAMDVRFEYAREKQVTAAGFNGKVSAFSAHLVYPLSKRTAIFAEALTGTRVVDAATTTRNTAYGIGLRHDF